jgi:hypothetical protein
MSTSMNATPGPTPGPQDDRLENEIELKDVAGLSQSQIVRRRFFRHKGAMIGLAVLIGIVLLAYTSLGVGPLPGWWSSTGRPERVITNPGGAPTLGLPTFLGGASAGW